MIAAPLRRAVLRLTRPRAPAVMVTLLKITEVTATVAMATAVTVTAVTATAVMPLDAHSVWRWR